MKQFRTLNNVTTLLLSIIAMSIGTLGQEYTDYANDYVQDSLYQDYARKQQEKADGGTAGRGGGGGLAKYLLGGAAGYFLGGKIHSNFAVKKLKKTHLKEQK